MARALMPASWVMRVAGAWRQHFTNPAEVPVPVVCVGNVTVGGGGKTPVVRDIAHRLRTAGINAITLSRGYGGRLSGPIAVDPSNHTAAEVGDEPLMLAGDGPAWVARNRALGAGAAVDRGADAIIMDDGHQNHSLRKTLSLLVVDPAVGFGNGRVFPAGPLREPARAGLDRADAVVFVRSRSDARRQSSPSRDGSGQAILTAYTALHQPPDGGWKGRRVHVLAGIARPGKVVDTLTAAGADVVGMSAFPDHHRFSELEAMAGLEAAVAHDAELVTTEKDLTRLPEPVARSALVARIHLVWDDEPALERLLAPIVTAGRVDR